MSFLTVAIILDVLLIIAFIIAAIADLSEGFATFTFMGVIIDTIVIVTILVKRYGWGTVLNTLLNIVLIVAFIGILIFLYLESYGNKKIYFLFIFPVLLGAWIITRFGLNPFISLIISSIVNLLVLLYCIKSNAITEEKIETHRKESNFSREKLLEYMKSQYPQYKFDGYTAKIFYNDYQYHAIGQESTIWSRVLEGKITVEYNGIEIRFYHPFGVYYGQKDNMQRMQVFFKRHNADCSYKLEFDSGKISIVDFLTVRETPISPSSALENRIFFTAKHLEDIDAELTKAIFDS